MHAWEVMTLALRAFPSRKAILVVAALALFGAVGTAAAATALESPMMPGFHVGAGASSGPTPTTETPHHHSGGCHWGGGGM